MADELRDVRDALLEADADGDGEISFQEFVNLMKRVPSRTLLGTNPEEAAGMMRRVSSRPHIRRIVGDIEDEYTAAFLDDDSMTGGTPLPDVPQRSASASIWADLH
eukprot:Blabericola_migrator_1__7315@NODE_371_length_9275_cov_101_492615_g292_i1_p10_GENE_NODE_371_length_9275_cov_101_492615_g292_i1NODE_371_length_9275_cov_101_492615_g292_i1_p10_ORF_typecomplete_len106_score15_88EFhand_1/PF00036_32/1_1e08EFhand_8/PF13833_6/1_9e06EFhand_7/PF13499_6/2_7e05EFhand_5/PF13202_6/7_1e05EFhand_6/PF13405_6/1_4e03EFhand_6/PF13405_6/0_0039_NODE_371_length_9275_cov_101_492615_g292_i111071424